MAKAATLEDVWKTLAADSQPPISSAPPPPPPRPRRETVMGLPPIARNAARPPAFQHQESGVDFGLIARTKAKYNTFVDATPPLPGLTGSSSGSTTAKMVKLPPSDARDERKLWWAAGALIGMAVCVLGVLGFMTFSPQMSGTAAVAAAPIDQPAPIAAPTVPVPAPSPTGIARPSVAAVRATRAEKRAEAPHKRHPKKARGRS
jgi:hypothetical protein